MTNKNDLTVEEAIIELNRCKINGYAPTDWDRRCKAVEVAKTALKKQIKQKPKDKMYDLDCCIGVCSKCGTGVINSENYCYQCGQALDWSSE